MSINPIYPAVWVTSVSQISAADVPCQISIDAHDARFLSLVVVDLIQRRSLVLLEENSS